MWCCFDLIIPNAERDVVKNFIKRHDQATRFILVDTYDLVQKDIFPNIHKLSWILLAVPLTSMQMSRCFRP